MMRLKETGKNRIKWLCILLSLLLAFPLCSCNEKSPSSSVNKDAVYEEAGEYKYRVDFDAVPRDARLCGDDVAVFYAFTEKTDDTGSMASTFVIFDSTDTDKESYSVQILPQDDLTYVHFAYGQVRSDGKFLLMESATSDGEEVYYYVIANRTGAIESQTQLKGTEPASGSDFSFLENGNLAFCTGNGFCVYSPQGDKILEGELPAELDYGFYDGAMCAVGNELVFYRTHKNGEGMGNYVCYDTITKTFGEVIKTDYAITKIKPGIGCDFFALCDSKAVWAMNKSGADNHMIFDLAESGIAYITEYVVPDLNRIIMFKSDPVNLTGNPHLYTKVSPEDVEEKTDITLGVLGLTGLDFSSYINDYNKKNSSFRIVIKDYGDENNHRLDEMTEAFKLDLISGDCPDILLCDSSINAPLYMKKGVFEDLTPYMEEAGMKKEDYLANVMKAGATDDKQYLFIPLFTVSGLCLTKSEYLNENGEITISGMRELEKEKGISGKGVFGATKGTILAEAVIYGGREYYDLVTGECDFDSDGFKDLIRWTENYPDTLPESQDSAKISRLKEFETGQAILETGCFDSIRSFHLSDAADFDGKAAIVGFSTKNGSSMGVINPVYEFGISAQSDYKKEAFDFIRIFMEDDFQTETVSVQCGYTFPGKTSAFDEFCKKQMEIPSVYSPSEGLYQEKDFYYRSGKKTEIEPIDEERLAYVKEYILNSKDLPVVDNKLLEIIAEELEPYYNGDKTLDEVTAIIQSRAEIYMNENR